MNREMRRFSEKEERRQKNQERKRPRRGGKPGERVALYKRVWGFLKEVRVELERVSWPTREQMIAFTIVTLITTTALTVLLFFADLGLREGVFALLDLGT